MSHFLGCEDHRCDERADCAACRKERTEFFRHLAEFGKSYLETMMTQEQAEAYAARNAGWSLEDEEALNWLKTHSISAGQ